MSNLIRRTKKRLYSKEHGQVLIVVAFAIVGIIAIMGLSLDVGVMFIENARLRRAVDAAALAAALQVREGYHFSDLETSAIEFLRLNGINDPGVIVQVCMNPAPAVGDPDYIHHDPGLCSLPLRKLVRVVASGTARLAFLPVIGIDTAPIAAEAVSQTASVDVVLVLDRSDSMTWAVPPGDPLNSHHDMRDPSICNADSSGNGYVGDCHPFDEVKRAAVSFVEELFFPYDRVAVVTFDKQATVRLHFSNDKSDIISAIKNLTVFQGDPAFGLDGINAIYPNGLPSRWYDSSGIYWGPDCPQADWDLQAFYPDYPNPAPCTTTNIGSGLYAAGVEFTVPPSRQEALWVVILLTDGVANAGYDEHGLYFCPVGTWINPDVPPKCNDGRSATRHAAGSGAYDAEDYAYDAADFDAVSQHALIFTIGLGDKVIQPSSEDGTPLGKLFLEYAADKGDGLYTFAPDSAALLVIFQEIANNILTRLAH